MPPEDFAVLDVENSFQVSVPSGRSTPRDAQGRFASTPFDSGVFPSSPESEANPDDTEIPGVGDIFDSRYFGGVGLAGAILGTTALLGEFESSLGRADGEFADLFRTLAGARRQQAEDDAKRQDALLTGQLREGTDARITERLDEITNRTPEEGERPVDFLRNQRIDRFLAQFEVPFTTSLFGEPKTARDLGVERDVDSGLNLENLLGLGNLPDTIFGYPFGKLGINPDIPLGGAGGNFDAPGDVPEFPTRLPFDPKEYISDQGVSNIINLTVNGYTDTDLTGKISRVITDLFKRGGLRQFLP